MIHHLTVIESWEAQSRTSTLGSRDELVAEVERRFKIPAAVVADAVCEVEEMRDAWSRCARADSMAVRMMTFGVAYQGLARRTSAAATKASVSSLTVRGSAAGCPPALRNIRRIQDGTAHEEGEAGASSSFDPGVGDAWARPRKLDAGTCRDDQRGATPAVPVFRRV